LPQMTGPALPCVDEAGIAPMRVGEGAAQPVLIRQHDDQMDVIRHQAVAPDLRLGLFRRRGEQVAIERVVAVLEEGRPPAIAALGHMIGHAGNDQPRQTHRQPRIPSCYYLEYVELVHLVNWHRNCRNCGNRHGNSPISLESKEPTILRSSTCAQIVSLTQRMWGCCTAQWRNSRARPRPLIGLLKS